jgi:membrane dipeptidase
MTAKNRRHAVGALMALAGATAFRARIARSQNATAPIGDSAPLADLGMPLSAEQRAAGSAFLQRHPSVDTHAHPGRFFLKNPSYQTPTTQAFGAPFEQAAIADLNAGDVSAALFAAVADMRLLEMTTTGGLRAGKDFNAGEAYADYKHVAIGTDMDANYKPVLRSYRDWSLIPAALLARGMRETEVASIMGGNFLRIFKANV